MMALIARKATLAFNAAEPVSNKVINMTSTVVADVGLTEWCTQTETNGYPGCLVIYLQALGRDRKVMQLQSEAPCRSWALYHTTKHVQII